MTRTLADVMMWLENAPSGTLVPTGAVLAQLRGVVTTVPAQPEEAAQVRLGWQERLWSAPDETRMRVNDICEALGRPKSWVYRHTSQAAGLPRIPHRKLDGELVFVAGEVRQWVREHEEVVHSATVPIKPIALIAGRRERTRVRA